MNSFEKWRLLGCRINQMDEVGIRLDQLLRKGKISKDQIFYKYLSDTFAKFYDKQHTYDADVTEFYSTIMYQVEGEHSISYVGQCFTVKKG